MEAFFLPYFFPGVSESFDLILQIKQKRCIVLLLEESGHWNGQGQHHGLEDGVQGDEKASKKQYRNVTHRASVEGELDENQAERKAKEHSLVTWTEATIITSTCVNFRSSAAKPRVQILLCSHLLCDLSSLSGKES